jgi:MoaA/NifB/PqqE/SkfB family radical SAM enzyme
MKRKIRYFLYAANYLVKTKIFRREIPFIGGLVINEKCNLSCKQCDVSNRNLPDLTYEDIKRGLQVLYDRGIRSVFIEGGEPFLWRDVGYRLEDVVKLARKIGFQLVSVYTNGTFPINVSTNSIFVSLDGLKETNNKLRGNVFDKVIQNIKESKHPNIIINFTINSVNQSEIERFCEEMGKIKQVRGIFFYFHTPYYGFDELFVNLYEKRNIIKRIIALKRKGYKIFNSLACLKGVYNDNWPRPGFVMFMQTISFTNVVVPMVIMRLVKTAAIWDILKSFTS